MLKKLLKNHPFIFYKLLKLQQYKMRYFVNAIEKKKNI